MRILLVLAGLLLSPVVLGEQSTDSAGDYAMDLGQAYGAGQAVKFMKEICSEAFPAQSQSNDGFRSVCFSGSRRPMPQAAGRICRGAATTHRVALAAVLRVSPPKPPADRMASNPGNSKRSQALRLPVRW